VNETGHAPVVRNLKGAYVFEGGNAIVCISHTKHLDHFTLFFIKRQLLKAGAREISIAADSCLSSSLNMYAIVIVERGSLLNGSKETIRALLDAIEQDAISRLAVISEREIKSKHLEELDTSRRFDEELREGVRSGFGAAVVENHSNGICLIVNSDAESHRLLIQEQLDRFE
jgi:hypothetical protein